MLKQQNEELRRQLEEYKKPSGKEEEKKMAGKTEGPLGDQLKS